MCPVWYICRTFTRTRRYSMYGMLCKFPYCLESRSSAKNDYFFRLVDIDSKYEKNQYGTDSTIIMTSTIINYS